MHVWPDTFVPQPLGRKAWEGMHRAVTREPGDLPAHGRSCHGPGGDQGTVFRLSDEPQRELHRFVERALRALACSRVPAVRTLMRATQAPVVNAPTDGVSFR